MFKLHVISGLPRSGSTLLSAILKQNPKFIAGMTSPVSSMCSAILPKMSGESEYASFFTDETRYRVLKNLFTGYYGDLPGDTVVFDTNRRWTTRLALLDRLFPSARVICCVREIGWILDSLERAIKKNPAHMSRLAPENGGRTVYGRVENFMKPEHGMVGSAWSGLREGWFSEHAKKLIIVPYENLVSDPQKIIKKLYETLGETPFPHFFDNIEYQEEGYDTMAGTPGLHTVKPRVEFVKRDAIIPPDLFKKYADNSFWLHAGANVHGVTVL